MLLSTLLSGLTAIGGLSLAHAASIASEFESEDFSVTGALENLGIDVTEIPALESFSAIEARSTEKACAAAVSAAIAPIPPDLAGIWTKANSNIFKSPVCKLEIPFRLQSLCSIKHWVQ